MFLGNFGYQYARASAAAPGKKRIVTTATQIVAMATTCARGTVLRRFDNTSLNGYQPLVVIPLVSTRMSAAAPGKTKRIVTTATHNGSIAVAGAQVSSTPSVSRVLFLSHTSNCGGRGRGGARSAARRGVRRVSEWAKALGFEVISPAS